MELEDITPIQKHDSPARIGILSQFGTVVAQLPFNHNNHGELPIRPDSLAWIGELFKPLHDEWWDDLILEAIGLTKEGIPWVQLSYPPTKRRISISVPCEGVIAIQQVYPSKAIFTTFPTKAPEPIVSSFTRIETESTWLKVAEKIAWLKESG